ncbi:chemotaxis protein CheD [Kineosporia succinea]|uniref:Probable chemoreceptor glutamine deamidase CheD n=1 Tax=Kineosporia succinea TaxID=84632 RepID=A0ABT9PBF1_9ACTN|nr:chemotaxis protein CheD [Kineosporia succinea]MDP9830034.1 chemotaxis protein CheD [Kineosporia succinea]
MKAHGEWPAISLVPGSLWFGPGPGTVDTLLGSCVAITVWHPFLLVGGMCHFLVPSRGRARAGRDMDARYADEAFALMCQHMRDAGTAYGEYRFSVYGGARQLAGAGSGRRPDVPGINIHAALFLINSLGARAERWHVGGFGPRRVTFDLLTGETQVRHEGAMCPETTR